MNIAGSQALLDRAWKVVPSATQTFSKGPNQWIRGVSPHFLERGEGAWVWDVDGNRYLDYLMALGPIILGYGNRAVNDAVIAQLEKGTVFSQMHPLEVEVSEKLVELIPCAEMVRFAKNGSDATTGAVRAARAATVRDRIVYCGYHGWHDWYIGTTTRNAGVPKAVSDLTHTFAYNDLESLKAVFDAHPGEIAAVIMEPIGIDKPAEGFLEGVRDLTQAQGALLVFDEIVGGFRYDLGGIQKFIGVTPDMATFGKAMANGMPLSAVVGRREVMDVFDEIFFSGTFGGETTSLAACLATIAEFERLKVVSHLWEFGAKLNGGLQALIDQHSLGDAIKVLGYDVRTAVAFPHADEAISRLRRSFFMQECHKRGLLYFGIHLPTAAHDDPELDFTLDVFGEVMPIFAAAYQADDFAERMEGEIVEAIFRKP